MGKIMDGSSQRRHVFAMPQTRPGWWSIGLAITFLVLFMLWLLYALYLKPIPRPTFFSDPLHAVLSLSAAVAAISGGFVGALAVGLKRERSIAVLLSVLLGALVFYWTIAEFIGH